MSSPRLGSLLALSLAFGFSARAGFCDRFFGPRYIENKVTQAAFLARRSFIERLFTETTHSLIALPRPYASAQGPFFDIQLKNPFDGNFRELKVRANAELDIVEWVGKDALKQFRELPLRVILSDLRSSSPQIYLIFRKDLSAPVGLVRSWSLPLDQEDEALYTPVNVVWFYEIYEITETGQLVPLQKQEHIFLAF